MLQILFLLHTPILDFFLFSVKRAVSRNIYPISTGKRYIFDIKRTLPEAYNFARRKLYSQSQSVGLQLNPSLAASQRLAGSVLSMDVDKDHNCTLDCASATCQVCVLSLKFSSIHIVCFKFHHILHRRSWAESKALLPQLCTGNYCLCFQGFCHASPLHSFPSANNF